MALLPPTHVCSTMQTIFILDTNIRTTLTGVRQTPDRERDTKDVPPAKQRHAYMCSTAVAAFVLSFSVPFRGLAGVRAKVPNRNLLIR